MGHWLVLGGLSQMGDCQPGCLVNNGCNTLKGVEDNGNLSPQHKSVMDNFPTDIGTVHKVFDLDPKLIIYVTCP
jgi:hypothetical protein